MSHLVRVAPPTRERLGHFRISPRLCLAATMLDRADQLAAAFFAIGPTLFACRCGAGWPGAIIIRGSQRGCPATVRASAALRCTTDRRRRFKPRALEQVDHEDADRVVVNPPACTSTQTAKHVETEFVAPQTEPNQRRQEITFLIRCAFFGPIPRTCASRPWSAVMTRSTDPKWTRRRFASAGPTPGKP